ncbi:MAG: sulfurtransferase [Chloroflexia bacterium]|nr:sulfurtransferase [Chloroflexia bacterium]
MTDHPPRQDDAPPRPAAPLRGSRALSTLISGAVLIGMALGFGWLFRAATVPLPVAAVTPVSVAGFPGNGSNPLLVDAAWLAERLTQPDGSENLVVLDLSDPRRYEAEHVPGAIHGWWQDTMSADAHVYGRRIQRPGGPFGYQELFRSLGVDSGSTVVVYDDDANRYAARLVWLLRFSGIERAMVLDGGLAAWKGAGQPVSDNPAQAPDAATVEATPRDEWVITTTELQERTDDPALLLLDTRSPAEATDDLNGTIRVGMIPGAVRIPWNETVRDASGLLRPPDELAARLRAAGVTPEKEVVVYGRFGVESGQPWLVLTLLGYDKVRVYDEGWASWAAIERLPVEPLPAEFTVPPGTPIAHLSFLAAARNDRWAVRTDRLAAG